MDGEEVHKKRADLIAGIHILWALLLLVGTLVVVIFPDYAVPQLVLLTGTLLVPLFFFGGRCPLTTWEERLRQKIEPGYSNNGSFMTTYINKTFGTNFERKSVKLTIAAFYVLSYAGAVLTLVFGRL